MSHPRVLAPVNIDQNKVEMLLPHMFLFTVRGPLRSYFCVKIVGESVSHWGKFCLKTEIQGMKMVFSFVLLLKSDFEFP